MNDQMPWTDAGPAPEGLIAEVEEAMLPDAATDDVTEAGAPDAEDAGPPSTALVAEIEGQFEPAVDEDGED